MSINKQAIALLDMCKAFNHSITRKEAFKCEKYRFKKKTSDYDYKKRFRSRKRREEFQRYWNDFPF